MKKQAVIAALIPAAFTAFPSAVLADIAACPVSCASDPGVSVWLAAALVLIAVPTLIFVIKKLRKNR